MKSAERTWEETFSSGVRGGWGGERDHKNMADSCKRPVKDTLQVILSEDDIPTLLGAARILRNHFSNYSKVRCATQESYAVPPYDSKKLWGPYRRQYFTLLKDKKKRIDTNVTLFF